MRIQMTWTWLAIAAAILATPFASAYEAHYFVVKEGGDGSLSVLSHQLVDIDGAPESAASLPQPSALEDHVVVTLRDKELGKDVFNGVAAASPWLRGEFHGDLEIDGRIFPLEERTYVVRVPVQPRTLLRLSGEYGMVRRAAAAGPGGRASRPAALLEIDLDLLSPRASVGPQAALPPGYATGMLMQSGSPSNRLDLLIVAEGYTAAQQSQFVADATALANTFLSISPYSDFRHLINVSWLFVPSNQSGADKPACSETPGKPVVVVDTAFDASFCSSGVRRLVTIDTTKVLTAAAAIPDWDRIMVLVNDSEYGGSGGSVSVATTNALSAQIMQHEFGHSFSLLADEYSTPFPGYPRCSDLAPGSPCEPNVTDQTVRASLKWLAWVDPATSVPTSGPLGDPVAAGLWLGARYLSAGMYRQCYEGIMRSLGRPFCDVDGEAFVKRLYGGWGGAPAQGVNLIEPTAAPAGSVVSAPVQTDVVFAGTLAGSLATAGLAYAWLVDNASIRTGTSVHGATVDFTYRVPNAGSHTVELRVSDSTPSVLIPPVRSRTWTMQGVARTANLSPAVVLGANINPSFAAQSVVFTASVSGATLPASGTVSFFDGGRTVCIGAGVVAGKATCTTGTLPAGSRSITAAYSGDANYVATTSAPYLQTVLVRGAQSMPGAPAIGTATAGSGIASVAFTAPVSDGGAAIDEYRATCTSSNGGAAGTKTGGGSPLNVSGLTNGKLYACTAAAHNVVGWSIESAASNGFTPTELTVVLAVTRTGAAGSVVSQPAGIACGTACSATYSTGSSVGLLATPAAGAVFSGWSDACSGKALCTLALTTARSATAAFAFVGAGSSAANEWVQKSYVAYYGRPADPAGLAYWASRMDNEGGSLSSIIAAFGTSAEFNRRYGGMTNTALVTKIYQQALGRDPDPAGLDWYVGELQAGRLTPQTITLGVINGAATGPDSTAVSNKLGVANHYTGKVASGCAYGTEQTGANSLTTVTYDPATAWAAKLAIESRCGP